jgi:hypothetical protein
MEMVMKRYIGDARTRKERPIPVKITRSVGLQVHMGPLVRRNYTNCMAFLEKLLVVQLLRNFPTFYEIDRFITMFKRAPSTGPYPQPDEPSPFHPIVSLPRSI